MIGFMAGDADALEWEACSSPSCRAAVVGDSGECIVHCDGETRQNLISMALGEGVPLDARGVRVSPSFITDLLERGANFSGSLPLPEVPLIPPAGYLPAVDFRGATLPAGVSLDRVVFTGHASFGDATIVQGSFRSATFGRGATFAGASFVGLADFAFAQFVPGFDHRLGLLHPGVSFAGATFAGEAALNGAHLGDHASFADARFDRGASFRGARFGVAARFLRARLGSGSSFASASFGDAPRFDGAALDGADFDRVSFVGRASFAGTDFGVGASFRECEFGERPRFASARFGERCVLGPCTAEHSLDLRGATLGAGTTLDVTTGTLLCNGLRVPEGAELRAAAKYIVLNGARFVGPTTISGHDYEGTLPTIESMYDVDVAGLAVNRVALRECRFAGAHNLDRLRHSGPWDFDLTPRALQLGWAVPPVWRWTRRHVLAEERAWRTSTAKRKGWKPPARRASSLETNHASPPPETESMVRNLKGLRDRLEHKHHIEIDDPALEAAAGLAARHLPEREGVDAGVNLLEQALEQAVIQHLEAVAGDDARGRELMEQVDRARRAKEEAILNQEFERAANLRRQEVKLTAELQQLDLERADRIEQAREELATERRTIGSSDVEAAASRWTGLPRERLMSRPAALDVPSTSPQPAAIGEVYRALRKGREDQKDSPGAADFYYGEMEMRRKAASVWNVERPILFIYWLTSGYALRASRAIVALLVLVAAFAFFLQSYGFMDRRSLSDAVVYSMGSTVPGLRPHRDFALTHSGAIATIALRLVGPGLLALALLSLRGRVRR